MSTKSETGHAINIANLQSLISFATGYGSKYNPSKAGIKLPALSALLLSAKASADGVTASATAYINATNARQIGFIPVKPLATRVVNALAATDAAKETVADAKNINRKVQGGRKTPLTDPNLPPVPGAPKQVSASQLSYDSQLSNLKKMISLVASEPTYIPNEPELQVQALNNFAAGIDANNTAVINAVTALSNGRIERNKILYFEKTGLVDLTLEIKNYIKSVFGAGSPEFKQVAKIKFTRPRS